MEVNTLSFQRFIFLSIFLLPAFVDSRPGQRINSFAGPYTIVVRNQVHKRNTSLDKWWSRLHFTTHMPGRPQYSWGTEFNSIDLDDTMDIDVRISKWSNNQWKENAFVMVFNHACTTMLTHSPTSAKTVLGDVGKKCPIKAATESRTIANKSLDAQFPNFPIFPYGRWLFTVTVLSKGVIVGSVSLDGEALPKL